MKDLGRDFFVAIGSLLLAICLGIWLTIHNYKELIRTKPERIRARSLFKKRKNRALAMALGIKLKDRNTDEEKKDDKA
jgi:hypothetical protein